MLLLFVLVGALIYPIDSLKTASSSDVIESTTSVDSELQRILKNNEQPVAAIEGQFIIAEGNSDHLFRSYDFIKEEAVPLTEGDIKDAKDDAKVRPPHNTINRSLPRIQIIEGHFISYENTSDEHLFDKEDFTKHDVILN